MARIRADYVFGTIDVALTAVATTISSPELARLPAVTGSDISAITLHNSVAGTFEIVHVTAHTASATTATITRGQEGSTAAAWAAGSSWLHGPTAVDFAAATGVQSVVAGTNVTVDSTDPANPIVSATGGGGGSSTHDLRWVAAAGVTSIDEFNDATLDAAWARVDSASAGNAVWTEKGDVLSVKHAGGATFSTVNAMMRSIGTSMVTGDAFTTCVSFLSTRENYINGGIFLADGTTVGSGSQMFSIARPTANVGLAFECFPITNWNSGGSGFGNVPNMFPPDGPIHLRIVKLASNTWRTDISPDGVSWILGSATATLAFTPTHVGLAVTPFNQTRTFVASFDYLRRHAGIS